MTIQEQVDKFLNENYKVVSLCVFLLCLLLWRVLLPEAILIACAYIIYLSFLKIFKN